MIASGTTLTLSASTATLGDGDTILISPGAKSLTIDGTNGGGLVLAGAATIGDFTGQSLTVSAPISGTGSLIKASAGALTLSGANTYTGGTTLNNGTLKLKGGLALADSGAVTVAGGALVLDHDETIGSLTSSGGTLTLAGHTLNATGVTLDASSLSRSANDTGLLTTSNTTGTAITGTATRPPTTLGSAPSIPATTTIASAIDRRRKSVRTRKPPKMRVAGREDLDRPVAAARACVGRGDPEKRGAASLPRTRPWTCMRSSASWIRLHQQPRTIA